MQSLRLSIPYPPPLAYSPAGPGSGTGYWGPVTSTLDWCEENYYATHYCAEIVNTLTNLWFVYLALRGVRNVLTQGHDRVFLLAYLAYLGIGVGSFAFHTSLTYTMQLVDEISMIYSTTILMYASLSYGTSQLTSVCLGVATGTLATGITIIYFVVGDPVFHQVAFFSITLFVLLRGVYLMETTLRPRWRKFRLAVSGTPERWTNGHGGTTRDTQGHAAQLASDAADMALLKRMYLLAGYGTGTALLGFGIWALDTQRCGTLRAWRRDTLGLPWGILLEGHGWWHLLTGTAGYINVMWHVWMRYVLYGRDSERSERGGRKLEDRDGEVELVWPSVVWSVPEVIKKQPVSKEVGEGKKRK